MRESGFARFPVLCPRWTRTGEDVYGTGPGFDAIGDCRQLQLLERRAAQAADKIVNPPMSAPVAARSTPISLLPGETNFVDGLGAGQALRPAVQIDPAAIDVFERKIAVCENRIRKAFFAHLWLLITEQTGQMTATEVDQRREEKLQQLGAVLEALNDELLDPLLDLLFDICMAAGLVPEPPEALQGVALKVDTSPSWPRREAARHHGPRRLAAFVLQLAAAKRMRSTRWTGAAGRRVRRQPGRAPATDTDDAVNVRDARARCGSRRRRWPPYSRAETAKTLSETDVEAPNASPRAARCGCPTSPGVRSRTTTTCACCCRRQQ